MTPAPFLRSKMLSIRAKHDVPHPWSCVACWLWETPGDGTEGSRASHLFQYVRKLMPTPPTQRMDGSQIFPTGITHVLPKQNVLCHLRWASPSHSTSWHFTVLLKLQQGVPWWPSSYDSGLSLSWTGFTPWLGNWDAASHAGVAKKKESNRVYLRWIASCKAGKLESLRANLLEEKQNNSISPASGSTIWS